MKTTLNKKLCLAGMLVTLILSGCGAIVEAERSQTVEPPATNAPMQLVASWTPTTSLPSATPSRTLAPSQTPTQTLVPTLRFYEPGTRTPTPISWTYDLGGVALPPECYGELLPEEQGMQPSIPCSDFTYSTDGRYLAFYFGPEVCWRGIIIMEVSSGQVLYRSPAGVGHHFMFLANGKVLVAHGHCEGGSYNLFDPETLESRPLGSEGEFLWNPDETAFVMLATPYMGITSAIWGYNLEEDTLFLTELETWAMDDSPIWTRNGEAVIYRHRGITQTDLLITFDRPSRIVLVEAETGEQSDLVRAADYDFSPCGVGNHCPDGVDPARPWVGDWLIVWRHPFTGGSVPFDFELYTQPLVQCLRNGLECQESGEVFGVNWRNGNMVPWDEVPRP